MVSTLVGTAETEREWEEEEDSFGGLAVLGSIVRVWKRGVRKRGEGVLSMEELRQTLTETMFGSKRERRNGVVCCGLRCCCGLGYLYRVWDTQWDNFWFWKKKKKKKSV